MALRRRGLAAALAGALALAALAATASASTFTIVESGFKWTSESVSFSAAERTVRCAVTLEGSFSSSTFAKTAESRVAQVSRAAVSGCTGGTVRVLEALPWSVLYSSFTGTLPSITSATFHITGAALQITPTGSPTCLLRSSERSPVVVKFERETTHGILTNLRVEEGAQIPLTGEGICTLVRGRASGTFGVKNADGRAEILLLLGKEQQLQGASEEETEEGAAIDPLYINAPATLGTRVLDNDSWVYEIRITAILKIGGNPETFSFRTEAAEDCRVGTALKARGNTRCNIRVEHAVAPPAQETSILITWEWGLVISTFGSSEFLVRAQ
jgi:hypothetical protein